MIRVKAQILALFTIIALSVYFFVRVIILSFSGYSIIEQIAAVALFSAEIHALLHSLGYMIYIVRKPGRLPDPPCVKLDNNKLPHVSIIVAARHEPEEVLRHTLTTFHNLRYKNKEIYLLDDSSLPTFKRQADNLAKEFNIHLFRRGKRHGAKAGIINDFINKKLKSKYLVIFDADQNPMPDFLEKVVSVMEADSLLGFVQTPQSYTNSEVSPIAKNAAMQQAIFYENICEGKSPVNSVFCCGTNVIFRVAALRSVGGFDEESITEDFATSVKIHIKGWKSLYYSHAKTFGMAPESLPQYFKQQVRWATGNLSILRKILWAFLTHPFKLKFVQWWEYFLSSTYYLVGIAFFILMISPINFLLFNIPSFFIHPEIYLVVYLPYFIFSIMAFYSTLTTRHYTVSDIYKGVIINFINFPFYILAAFYGFSGKKMKFEITQKGNSEVVAWPKLWPYYAMILLSVVALFAGFIRFHENPYGIGINIFWISYHLFILMHIFWLNKKPKLEDN
ncbi:glycosyltransferase [bacterium]|nr:glycosyltransferase [bacterium]